jgi:putative transposase
MPNYRRVYQPGASWFFTVNLYDRRRTLLTDHVGTFWQALRKVKRQRPFRLDACVVLPDHIHAIWTLPDGDTDFPSRWRLIKTHFTKTLPEHVHRQSIANARGEREIWQRRYWEHLIRDDDDDRRHVAYCYFNPVKHRLVDRVRDWPHSTFHRDVRVGWFAPDYDFPQDHKGAWGE